MRDTIIIVERMNDRKSKKRSVAFCYAIVVAVWGSVVVLPLAVQ